MSRLQMMTTGPMARLLPSFGVAKHTQVLAAGRLLRDRIRVRRAPIPAPFPAALSSAGVLAITNNDRAMGRPGDEAMQRYSVWAYRRGDSSSSRLGTSRFYREAER